MELKKYLKGKSRSDFAKLIGISKSAIDKYCSWDARPSIDTAKKIHSATGGRVKWYELINRPKTGQKNGG